MKTPREFFFQKHRSAETKLDTVRENALAAISPRAQHATPKTFPSRVVLKLWQELIFPCRRAWIGLAAVWVVLLAIHLGSADASPKVLATIAPAPGPGILEALREQRQMLVQLLEPFQTGPADRPKLPGPRGALEIVRFV